MPDHAAEKDWIDQRIPCRSRSRAVLGIAWQRGIRYKNPEHEKYPIGTPEVVACDDIELFYNPRSPPEVIDHSTASGYEPRTFDDFFERLVPYRAVYGNQALHDNLFRNIILKHFTGMYGRAGRFEKRFLESPFSKNFEKEVPSGDPAHGVWVTRRNDKVACKLGTFNEGKIGGRATIWDMCKCPWNSTSIDIAGVVFDTAYSIPTCIENYHALKGLSITNHQINDVANLARAPGIEHLDLSRNKLRGIPTFVLSSLKNLKNLAIRASDESTYKISFNHADAGNFNAMKSLESIDISGMTISTSKWMAELPKLKRVNAEGSNLCVVPATSENPALKELVLNGATCNTDGNDIATWKNLEHLEIENTGLDHADAIGSLKKMRVLDLSRNEHVMKSREIIGSMTRLKKLRLHDVGLPGIEFIKDLSDLEVLDISDSGVDDFTPIAGLKKLKRLNACASMISETRRRNDDASFAAIGNVEDVDLRLNDAGFSDLAKFPGVNRIAIDFPSENDIPDKVKVGEKLETIDLRADPRRAKEITDDAKIKMRVLKRYLADKKVKVLTGAAPGTTEYRPCVRW